MSGIACFDIVSGVLPLWLNGGAPMPYLKAHVPLNKRFSFFFKVQTNRFMDISTWALLQEYTVLFHPCQSTLLNMVRHNK